MPKEIVKDIDNAAQTTGSDEELVKIALSRGIFFQSAEVFGNNLSGIWDYGPIGLAIFNNIIREWRRLLAEIGAVEISGGVILPRKVLQASGHENNFFDMAILCSKCGALYRVDKLLEDKAPGKNYEGLSDEKYLELIKSHNIKCESCGGELKEIRKFGSMFGLTVGAQGNIDVNAYLRPEACQSIFLDFKRLFSLYGKKLPLIVAQVGKAFRNEISPRNNLLRQREFYQNDIEIFFLDETDFKIPWDAEINIADKKGDATIKISKARENKLIETNVVAYGISVISKLLDYLGFDSADVRYRKLYEDKAFYSKESFDVEIKKGKDWVEVIACNHRSDYDLSSYEKFGGETVKVDGRIPNIFEISAGTDRLFYLALYNSMRSDKERTWFALKNRISPFKAAIFPLLSKEDLEKASVDALNGSFYKDDMYYLDSGSIGKRYRKADEIGIPLAITFDYQTLKDNTATARDRDDMSQFRFNIKDFDTLIKTSLDRKFSTLKKTFEIH